MIHEKKIFFYFFNDLYNIKKKSKCIELYTLILNYIFCDKKIYLFHLFYMHLLFKKLFKLYPPYNKMCYPSIQGFSLWYVTKCYRDLCSSLYSDTVRLNKRFRWTKHLPV